MFQLQKNNNIWSSGDGVLYVKALALQNFYFLDPKGEPRYNSATLKEKQKRKRMDI